MNHSQPVRRLRRLWRGGLLSAGFFMTVGVLAAVANAAPAASSLREIISLLGVDGHGGYTSHAYFRVAVAERRLVFQTAPDAPNLGGKSEFEIFRNTQQQYLKSRFVLLAALRRPEVKKLNIDKREDDPVRWLGKRLRVRFPGDGEIMEISLTSKDREEAHLLVKAVVDAYMSEVVDVERSSRKARLNELDRAYAEAEAKVRKRRNDLKELAEALGASDTKAISLKQQVALEQFGVYQRQLVQTEIDLGKLRSKLEVRQALLKTLADAEISEAELDKAARRDLLTSQVLFPMLAQLKRQLLEVQSIGPKPGEDNESVGRLQRAVKEVEDQLSLRRKELREGLRQDKAVAAKADIQRLEVQIAVAVKTDIDLAKEAEKRRSQVEKLSGSSIEFDMMRNGLEQMEKTLNQIATEREKCQIELRSPSRITLIQPADFPESKD